MKVDIVTKRLEEVPADALVVGLHVGETKLPERLARLDRAAQGQLKRVLDAEKFSGKAGQVTHAHADGRRIVVAGLGARSETTAGGAAPGGRGGGAPRPRSRRAHGGRRGARRSAHRAPARAGRRGGRDPRHVSLRPLQAREGGQDRHRAPPRRARRAPRARGEGWHAARRELRAGHVVRARPDQRARQRSAPDRSRARRHRARERVAHRGQGARAGRVQEDGDGRVSRRGGRERAAAEVHPSDLQPVRPARRRPQAKEDRAHRQGHHVRLRRARPQAPGRHAAHEVRHGRRRGRARHHARAARAQARGRGPRADRGDREHAVRLGHSPGRRAPRDERHDDRDRQHRRRGAPDPGRRPLLRQHEHPGRRDHRHGDPDRRLRHRARSALLGPHVATTRRWRSAS